MNENGIGELYLCATPIGNLEDMTFRCIRVLKEADVIAAEDTRNSIKLLNHFEIKTPMTSYHEFNKVEKARVLVEKMLKGETVALITDAGTPGISDPGEELVRQCIEAGIKVTPVPGAAACINALIMSGMPTRRFCFEAFLPSDKKEKADVLEQLKAEQRTIIIYEAPHRLLRTLTELESALGGMRKIAVCKELTKRHETVYRDTISGALGYYTANEPKGEYVLVIEGRSPKELLEEKRAAWDDMSIEEHFNMYVSRGMDKKDAMKLVAKDRGVSKRDIYNALLD
ncbi:MAG TPA: 16S rRNA (cytidine(1402)-2'-O)-methyltransferase [Eubacterium sp.]|nr:16S rRNA (cytidine(1402)-2'-O)-methyltransferase [Eubacterium sp.]